MSSTALAPIWLGFRVERAGKEIGMFGRIVPKIRAQLEIHRFKKLQHPVRSGCVAHPFVRFPN